MNHLPLNIGLRRDFYRKTMRIIIKENHTADVRVRFVEFL